MSENSLKSKLSKLSDDELYKLIYAVCTAAGLEKQKADYLTSDIPKLRRMLTALSDKQISSLLASLGTADAGEMINKLGQGGR